MYLIKYVNKRGYNQVNNSDDGHILEKNGFLENSQILGSQTSKNPAFLEVPAHKKEGEYDHLFGDPIILPVFGSDQQLIEAWVELKRSPHTKRAYIKVGEEFLSFIHPKTLKQVTLPNLQQFLGTYKYKSHETIRQKIAIVQSLFSFAVKVDYLPKSPAVLIPSLKSHSQISNRRLTEEEVFRMIDRTVDVRDNAILRTLYNGGLRRSELVALNWEDLHFSERGECLVTVIGKGDTKATVGLNASTAEQLFISREGTRLSVDAVLLLMKKAALRAGLTKKVSPHWLRNAHATHARARGAPLELVQETLRHKDITTTRRYVSANPEDFSGRYLGM
jgi:integrase/recombinase XerD